MTEKAHYTIHTRHQQHWQQGITYRQIRIGLTNRWIGRFTRKSATFWIKWSRRHEDCVTHLFMHPHKRTYSFGNGILIYATRRERTNRLIRCTNRDRSNSRLGLRAETATEAVTQTGTHHKRRRVVARRRSCSAWKSSWTDGTICGCWLQKFQKRKIAGKNTTFLRERSSIFANKCFILAKYHFSYDFCNNF